MGVGDGSKVDRNGRRSGRLPPPQCFAEMTPHKARLFRNVYKGSVKTAKPVSKIRATVDTKAKFQMQKKYFATAQIHLELHISCTYNCTQKSPRL